jgi:hypothetical protein
MKLKKSWISKITILVSAVILIWSMFNIKAYSHAEEEGNYLIDHDVQQYYSYLPAAFIYKDLSFAFVDNQPYEIQRHFWRIPVKDQPGKYVVKMSLGLSYVYLPFFVVAHTYASYSDEYTANGFSKPYEFALAISSICFVLMGLWFLRIILLRWFSEWITAITLLHILFSTNLYYYTTTEPAMSHAYLFGLFAIFIHQSIKWVEHQKWQQAIWLGIIGGIIVCIRPIHVLIFIFPLLYNVKNFTELNIRLKCIFSKYGQLFIMTIAFLSMLFPQLLFWKYYTGSWIYYSYTEEGFFFSNPQIWNGLFSYRKGWLVYTPLFIFSLAGIYMLFNKHKNWFIFIIIYIPLYIYVVFSWWCWWYGGSFGSRAMIEAYPFLAIPLAAFIQHMASKQLYFKLVFGGVLFFLLILNLVQTQQKRLGLIHWDGMTQTAYWRNFMKLEDVGGIWGDFREPNYDAALKGQREYNTIGNEVIFLKKAGYFDSLLTNTKNQHSN